jgi:hypothetical protein
MANQIYVVDPATREPVRLGPVSFRDIGIRERDDLERWIAKDPGLLGERLLVISSEFSGFDKSNRRLDILALDSKGSIVIIELRLDANHSLADQQAIRYAAMCSDMTMDDVVRALAESDGCSTSEAEDKLRLFLGEDKVPALFGRPRIILAAGSIEDHELTSCVLWLRGYGVDISCVELTPYQVSDSRQVILIARTIIPIPESSRYQVSVTHKEDNSKLARKEARAAFWAALAGEFNKLGMGLQASGRCSGVHMCLRFGCANIHYEWIVRRRQGYLDVALHFEFGNREESFRRLEIIRPHISHIRAGISLPFELVPWGRRWAEARFRMPYLGRFPGEELIPEAVRVMGLLVERTWELVRPRVEKALFTSSEPSELSIQLLGRKKG